MFKPKKIIIILLSIILILPCVFIPVSAETIGTTITSFNQFCELDYVQIYHGISNSDDMVHFTDYSNSYLVDNSLFVDVSGDKGFSRWQVYKIVTYFKIKPAYQIEGFSEGSFLITVDDEHSNYYGFLSKTNDGVLYRADTSNGDLNRGQMEYNYFQRSTGRFVQNPVFSSYDTFWCEFYITNKVNLTEDYTFVFNFSNLNYKIMTKDEKVLLTLVQNQNENADKIMQNQNENTQAIIDNQNQQVENERIEANTTGDSGVNDIGSVIPNESQGFINSINNLVGTMSYNGTDCNWDFPSVSLPKIDGVMPEIKLWDKKEIPFEYWISQIPSGIMTLVQSLLTIALIVYCFKELYSIISYVLTLRGGGSNE